MTFTSKELAEMAAADAEIERSFRITSEERRRSRALDAAGRIDALIGTDRHRSAAAKKEYYEANREKIAAAKKEYYEANREKIAAAQKEYYEANREKTPLPRRSTGRLTGRRSPLPRRSTMRPTGRRSPLPRRSTGRLTGRSTTHICGSIWLPGAEKGGKLMDIRKIEPRRESCYLCGAPLSKGRRKYCFKCRPSRARPRGSPVGLKSGNQ